MFVFKRNQIDFFKIFFNDFDVLMLRIKINFKNILIYFQAKNTFEKHPTSQYQT
jgi:calcineurin-like phosphoesterase